MTQISFSQETATVFDELSGELSSGTYYLDSDVTLNGNLVIKGQVDLSLDGHVLMMSTDNYILVDGENAVLNIHDGEVTEHKFSISADGKSLSLDEESGNKIISGGVITGSEITEANPKGFLQVVNGATLNVYGASFVGNRAATSANGISLIYAEKANVNLYAGAISGNHVYSVSSSNRVATFKQCEVYIGESFEISGNTVETKSNSIISVLWFDSCSKVEIDADLTANKGFATIFSKQSVISVYGDITESEGAYAVYTKADNVVALYGNISDNAFTNQAVYGIESTLNIYGDISYNYSISSTCTVLRGVNGSKINLYGKMIGNISAITSSKSIYISSSALTVGEFFEIDGDNAADIMINTRNDGSYGIATLKFEAIPASQLRIEFYNTASKIYDCGNAKLSVSDGIDKQTLVEKLEGITDISDFILDGDEIKYVAHSDNEFLGETVGMTCLNEGLTEGEYCSVCSNKYITEAYEEAGEIASFSSELSDEKEEGYVEPTCTAGCQNLCVLMQQFLQQSC